MFLGLSAGNFDYRLYTRILKLSSPVRSGDDCDIQNYSYAVNLNYRLYRKSLRKYALPKKAKVKTMTVKPLINEEDFIVSNASEGVYSCSG